VRRWASRWASSSTSNCRRTGHRAVIAVGRQHDGERRRRRQRDEGTQGGAHGGPRPPAPAAACSAARGSGARTGGTPRALPPRGRRRLPTAPARSRRGCNEATRSASVPGRAREVAGRGRFSVPVRAAASGWRRRTYSTCSRAMASTRVGGAEIGTRELPAAVRFGAGTDPDDGVAGPPAHGHALDHVGPAGLDDERGDVLGQDRTGHHRPCCVSPCTA